MPTVDGVTRAKAVDLSAPAAYGTVPAAGGLLMVAR
jgi:hypothetical protein